MKKTGNTKKKLFHHQNFFFILKSGFWFLTGVVIAIFFLTSFGFLLFRYFYGNTIYPGVTILNNNFGGKSQQAVTTYFEKRNRKIGTTTFTFTKDALTATVSAKELQLGFDSRYLAKKAYDAGRSRYTFANLVFIFHAYINGYNITPVYSYKKTQLFTALDPLIKKETVPPLDAQFIFDNGKVTAFTLSKDGQAVDTAAIEANIKNKIPYITLIDTPQIIRIAVPVKVIKPKIASENVNNLGIKELIGTGTSFFQHSIPERIYNVELGASRVTGILVAPGEVFSFDNAVGDISALTGYKQAYVIQNGKTVLGDGGGICQVSTTLFRALLNAGLPIVERHAHAYRVGYYEEQAPPGIDATIFVPSIDLKFKNDTGHSILLQSIVDPNTLQLTYNLYGTRDGRRVAMTTPVVTGVTPPPPDLYQDDPTLPTGVVKQTDFAAWGAHVSFSRTVMKDNKIYLSDTFNTDYRPWQAIYLRGTGPGK